MIHSASSTATLPKPENAANQLAINFWGVRGSVPTPSPANRQYGGNTVCVEILLGDQRIIFDGGTGLVGLGHSLQSQAGGTQAHLFFTHTQWDRIQGFPFFQPAFDSKNQFSIYGGVAPNGASIKHCLTEQMLKPHFSMPLQNMQAELAFHTLMNEAELCIGDITVKAIKTNEATEAFGYRLTWQDRTLVYATDTPIEQVDPTFLKFVDNADILIYDGTYSDLSYLHDSSNDTPKPWALGAEIAQKANITQLILLHHSPIQDDATLDQLQTEVRTHFPNTLIAKEGMNLSY